MATRTDPKTAVRLPLSRERVLRGAVALADKDGIDAVTMRRLAQELGVEAMSLYNHVANKDEILDGIVDVIVNEINDAVDSIAVRSRDWKGTVRDRILAARAVLLRHPWAPAVIESRTAISQPMYRYYDALIGSLREAGFSTDLIHHALHTLGSRALGFTQELYDDAQEMAEDELAMMMKQMAGQYPNLTAMVSEVIHDADTTLGWCDDQVEFEFALDLMLDGLDRLRAAETRTRRRTKKTR